MIFPLGHQSKLTMFLQNASISTNLISLSLLRLWKHERGFRGRHRDGALHHAVPSKGNTIGSMPIAIGVSLDKTGRV